MENLENMPCCERIAQCFEPRGEKHRQDMPSVHISKRLMQIELFTVPVSGRWYRKY